MGERERLLSEEVRSLKAQIDRLEDQKFELKAVEETLIIEKERAQRYLDVAAVIFIVIDANRRVSLVNKKGCEILGGTEDMIIGRDWFDTFLLDEDKRRVAATFDTLVSGSGGNAEYYENSIKNLAGEIKIIAWHNAPVRNEKGDVTAVLSSGEDITERKKVAADFVESEGRLRTIFENAHDGIIMVDEKNKKYAYSNPMLRRMLGYSAEEIQKLSVMDIHPKEDLPYILEQFERLKKREAQVVKDIPVKKKDGSVLFVDINGFEVIFSGKAYVVGFFRDISERKKAEKAVDESEKRYRMLFDAAPMVITFTTSEGRVLAVNNAIKELSGYTPEEFMGMDVKDVYVNLDDRRRIFDLLYKDGRVRNFETGFKIKDGSAIFVLLNADAIEVGDKKMILATIRDITEHKKAEEALERQRETLEQKNVALSEILVQIEIEKNKIKKQIAVNVDELIFPIVKKLLKKGISRKNIQLLERNLKTLTDSFGFKITDTSVNLTPREIEICDMIKNGFSGKDIAEMLNISLLTVNKHRRNIRGKFGISNKNVNLTSFLRTL